LFDVRLRDTGRETFLVVALRHCEGRSSPVSANKSTTNLKRKRKSCSELMFFVVLRQNCDCMSSEKAAILSSIRALGSKVLPEGARLVLFGSQARNDAREDSDWDLLILLSDRQLQKDNFGAYAYPFVELGWEYGTYFSPKIYTYAEWAKRKGTPFYDNIDKEGVVLC